MAFASDKGRQGAAGQGAAGGFSIDNSLRFNDDDSAYLSWTPSSSGNRQKWTFSCWAKFHEDQAGTQPLFSAGAGSNYTKINLISGGHLAFMTLSGGDWAMVNKSDAILRDFSGWYHIMCAVDTTQGTNTDRVKLYLNGSLLSTYENTWPSLNVNTFVNDSSKTHYIAKDSDDVNSVTMAEVNFIDGQALTPSDFGEEDTDYKHWKPIAYAGSYGTNGFHLDFKLSAATSSGLGNDANGSNNWTPNNLASTDQLLDTPTNNFCTLNPLDLYPTNASLKEGNLELASTSYCSITGTLPMTTGKWYWEVYVKTGTANHNIGVRTGDNVESITATEGFAHVANGISYQPNGGIRNNDVDSSYGATHTTGDIIGITYDGDNGNLSFYKNNSAQGTAVSSLSGSFLPALGSGNSTPNTIANFGQDSSFAGNKTAQGNQDGNSIGDFYYTPPTGFLALCTSNLTAPAVKPQENFGVDIFTGNGSSYTVTTDFAPGLIWSKQRTTTAEHGIVDSVRGLTSSSGGFLSSSKTDEEKDSWSYNAIVSSGNNITSNYLTGYTGSFNTNASTQVLWYWKAGGTAVSNTNGSITSSVSANADAGFSIVSYTGTGVNATVGHGLSSIPQMVFIKSRDSAYNWRSYNETVGNTGAIHLNLTDAIDVDSAYFQNTTPTNQVFSIGTNLHVNKSLDKFIAYCFHSVDGYSKVGSYTGNGRTDGTFVYTGFRPAYVLYKVSSTAGEWELFDTSRDTYNEMTKSQRANRSAAVYSDASVRIDCVSNGFKFRAVNSYNSNASSQTYIYLAFAEYPFKHTNAR